MVNRGTDCASIADDILVANRSDGGEGFAYVSLRREEIVEEGMQSNVFVEFVDTNRSSTGLPKGSVGGKIILCVEVPRLLAP
jgi:hypothetical protein